MRKNDGKERKTKENNEFTIFVQVGVKLFA